MKRIRKMMAAIVIVLAALACVCCSSEKEAGTDYSDYVGVKYTGEDPWGNSLSITLQSIDGSDVSFEYEDVIGEGDYMSTFKAESSGELEDGVVAFHITATAAENEAVQCDYTGSLELKDGSLFVTYDDGQVNEESPEGGSASYQAQGLEGDDKTVELTAE